MTRSGYGSPSTGSATTPRILSTGSDGRWGVTSTTTTGGSNKPSPCQACTVTVLAFQVVTSGCPSPVTPTAITPDSEPFPNGTDAPPPGPGRSNVTPWPVAATSHFASRDSDPGGPKLPAASADTAVTDSASRYGIVKLSNSTGTPEASCE